MKLPTSATGAWLYGVHTTCAEAAAVSRGTSHARTKERYQYTTPWILTIRALKGYSHSFRITCDMCAVNLLERKE